MTVTVSFALVGLPPPPDVTTDAAGNRKSAAPEFLPRVKVHFGEIAGDSDRSIEAGQWQDRSESDQKKSSPLGRCNTGWVSFEPFFFGAVAEIAVSFETSDFLACLPTSPPQMLCIELGALCSFGENACQYQSLGTCQKCAWMNANLSDMHAWSKDFGVFGIRALRNPATVLQNATSRLCGTSESKPFHNGHFSQSYSQRTQILTKLDLSHAVIYLVLLLAVVLIVAFPLRHVFVVLVLGRRCSCHYHRDAQGYAHEDAHGDAKGNVNSLEELEITRNSRKFETNLDHVPLDKSLSILAFMENEDIINDPSHPAWTDLFERIYDES